MRLTLALPENVKQAVHAGHKFRSRVKNSKLIDQLANYKLRDNFLGGKHIQAHKLPLET